MSVAPEFDELAQVHVPGEIGYARRLLHVVRDDRDRVVLLQLRDQLLDLRRRDGIERRRRLVQQQHLGLDRDRARDAKPLLLPAGQRHPALLQLVLGLAPHRRLRQRPLDALVHVPLREIFVQTDAECDVVVDRHRKRRRLLEHHADLGPQHVEVDARIENILAVEDDLAGRPLPRVERIHPVERAQQGRLAAPGRTDERGDATLGDVEMDRS